MKEFVLTQITGQYYQDLKTTRELKISFDRLHSRTLVQWILKSMPSTAVRYLSLLCNSESDIKDVELLARFKDLHAQLEASMEMKLKFINSFN